MRDGARLIIRAARQDIDLNVLESGKGYATEASIGSLDYDYARREFGIKDVSGYCGHA